MTTETIGYIPLKQLEQLADSLGENDIDFRYKQDGDSFEVWVETIPQTLDTLYTLGWITAEQSKLLFKKCDTILFYN